MFKSPSFFFNVNLAQLRKTSILDLKSGLLDHSKTMREHSKFPSPRGKWAGLNQATGPRVPAWPQFPVSSWKAVGRALDSPIASALRAPAFLIEAFGELHVDLAQADTPFFDLFFFSVTVPLAAREGSGEGAESVPAAFPDSRGWSQPWQASGCCGLT